MSGFFTAPRIAWGPGAIEQLSGLGARRALVVVDPAVARADGQRRIVEELGKSDVVIETIADLLEPDRVATVARLGSRARELGVDWLIGVGGGRTLDAVKAARIPAERPDLDLSAAPPMLELAEPPRLRVAAVPTTAGSGSDASWAADLWTEAGAPVEIAHRALIPDWSVVDPQNVSSLPPELRLEGAIETLGQATESYLSAWANPFSDALAFDAVATVLARLPHAIRWSDDPDAASALLYAATAAGLAASNSQRGLAHALARAFQPATHLPYGRLLGIALPVVLDFDYPSARERIERLSGAGPEPEAGARASLAVQIRRLYDRYRFPLSLAAAGIPAGELDLERSAIVERTLRSPATLANPRVPSTKDAAELVDAIVGRA